MGKLEAASRKRKKKQDIQQAVLTAVAVTGVLALTAIAPNTLQLLRYLPNEKYTLGYRTKTAAQRLVAKKYALWVEREGKKYLQLTQSGQTALQLEQEKTRLAQEKKKKWDGRWRMVVFDVPEKRRRVRACLRAVMRETGFIRLQDSVWVYPYDCEDFIALLKAQLRIGKDVLYAIADTIERDRPLREHFKLPLG